MSAHSTLLTLDGSHGEGGGALLRTALSMSVLTQQAFRVEHIRTGTKFSGLDVEDLTLISALQKMTDAEVSGAEPGSLSLLFVPKRAPRPLNEPVLTVRNERGRGSNALVIASTLIPILARTGRLTEIQATGETNANNAMSFDYFSNVVGYAWQKMNLHMFCDLERSAWSREGNGIVNFEIEPGGFQGIQWLDRGEPKLLRAMVTGCRVTPNTIERAVSHLQKLAQSCRMKIDIDTHLAEGDSTGLQVTVWMQYQRGLGGGSEMGGKNVRAEQVAQNAFEKCFDWMTGEATVDPILAEHLLLPACFAEGSTEFKVSEITPRLQTSIWVIKQFSPVRIVNRGSMGGFGHISISR